MIKIVSPIQNNLVDVDKNVSGRRYVPPLIQIFVVVALFCSFAFFGTVSLETSIKLVNPDYI